MINFIPIFPLGIVVYPGESLNLHIFEPRYKQLVTECFAEKKMFGIPAVINNHLLPIRQSTQLQCPMLSRKSSDANIGSSSRHKPISRSGRSRRIQLIRYRYTSSRVERWNRSRPSSDFAPPSPPAPLPFRERRAAVRQPRSNDDMAFSLPSLSSISRRA